MPTNLYGPGDNYDSINSHVIPALIFRFHNAKIKKLSKVTIWGSGKPMREFLYVDDMARACIKLMNIDKKIYYKYTSPMSSHINVGSGFDLSIKEIALMIKDVVGYEGQIDFDVKKPDGVSRKLLDNKIIRKFNFKPLVSLKSGLTTTYQNFLKNK